ncbi:hypothetical protein CTAYLR_003215 [Chrysophaeum taylorii]|uniref:EGF-like domain-containing protein n=1 Tax=Chrysophaeum taylorii TaxID=2483200 RepID=A0AAD7UCK2_9STRA|nr:hypothetical protein CTAYLR_003215 [Chrysophaeum taylorii]
MTSLLLLLFFWVVGPNNFLVRAGDCIDQNYCNGHGTCVESTSRCECYDGWGSDKDVAVYKSYDCSLRTCASGRAWADLPMETHRAHALAECSNKGSCNRQTGTCECFPGFTGDACQRKSCVNDCSGHGRCVSLKRMASLSDALPLSASTTYAGNEDTTRWDQNMIFGCVCDSSWEVGTGAGQRQEPEWFGYDCSKRHCPSGDDPYTVNIDETDCTNVTAAGGSAAGAPGNECHVDCANRGICDYETGVCDCFQGSYGHDCTLLSALAL